MSKSILLVGATGFVGGKILNLIDDGNSKITLLSRKKLNHKSNLKQIITNFDDIDEKQGEFNYDEVYIAIGKKLSLLELLYIKKEDRNNFKKVDLEYIKKAARYAKNNGAKSIGLISAVGANKNSKNTYLAVKGKTEEEIISMNFNKTVIAQPGHLLGERENESISYIIFVFEFITNFFGLLLIGPFKKFKNVDASKVAKCIVDKMNDKEYGARYLTFDDFKAH